MEKAKKICVFKKKIVSLLRFLYSLILYRLDYILESELNKAKCVMKTKRIFVRISLLCVALVFPFSASWLYAADGETAIIGQLKFTTLGDISCQVEAADKSSISGAIVIPATAEINGKSYVVSTIAENAFNSCKKITSVTIESNYLKTIGQRAFLYCSGISDTIFIPASMDAGASIGIYAFADIFAPVKFLSTTPPTLNVNATNGSYPQFRNAKHKITIPCHSMATYLENPGWASNGDLLYDPCYAYEMDFEGLHYSFTSSSTATLKGLADGAALKVLDIPATVSCNGLTYNVSAIADSAFIGNSVITKLAIPSTVETIGVRAFNVCTGLVSIQFAQEGVLATVKDRAFLGCKNIKDTVIIPASIAKIEPYAFADWTSLDALQFAGTTPPNLVIAGGVYGQFRDNRATPYKLLIPCSTRSEYTVKEGWGTFASRIVDPCVESTFTDGLLSYSLLSGSNVKVDGFASGVSATELDIPSKVIHNTNTYNITIIGAQAFKGKNLTSVSIPSTVVEIEFHAFANNDLLEEVVFSEGLSIIRYGAFLNDKKIGRIEIPSTVKTIEYSAFGGNTSIDTAFINTSTPPIIGNTNPFAGTYPIVVPCGTLEKYKIAPNWSSFSSRFVSACKPLTLEKGDALTQNTIVSSIEFRRTFPMNLWQELYLPFEMDSMFVIDDGYWNAYFPFNSDSAQLGGYFYLYGLKEINMTTGIITFQEEHKIKPRTPYLILFVDKHDDYFEDKKIVFKSKQGEYTLTDNYIAPELTPSYQLFGNETLWKHSVPNGFTLSPSFSDENGNYNYNFHFNYAETAELPPFSWVVTPTMAIQSMPSLAPRFLSGRWGNQPSSGGGDTPTSMQTVSDWGVTYTQTGSQLTLYTQGQPCKVYSIDGTLLLSTNGSQEEVSIELDKGMYIIYSNGHSQKVLF